MYKMSEIDNKTFGLKLSFKTPFFTKIEFIQLSKALINLWIFWINQGEDGEKYLLNSFENGLAQELQIEYFVKWNKLGEVRWMKKAMIALGLVVVMFFGVAYIYAQNISLTWLVKYNKHGF
jgi:hypothetical protein